MTYEMPRNKDGEIDKYKILFALTHTNVQDALNILDRVVKHYVDEAITKRHQHHQRNNGTVIKLHLNQDGSIALDLIVDENPDCETWEIIDAVEKHTIIRTLNAVSSAAWEPSNSEGNDLSCHGEIVDAAIREATKTLQPPSPACTHPHAARQGDEVFCPHCGFRCDHNDPDAPGCS